MDETFDDFDEVLAEDEDMDNEDARGERFVNGEQVHDGIEILEPEHRAIEPSQRTTTRYMTKYEKARLLGTRALQIRCVISRICRAVY